MGLDLLQDDLDPLGEAVGVVLQVLVLLAQGRSIVSQLAFVLRQGRQILLLGSLEGQELIRSLFQLRAHRFQATEVFRPQNLKMLRGC